MKTISRICFAHLPTPIESLPHLSIKLGGVRIYIKRDDQTGLAFGGNKTRKLEFLIPEAMANDAKTLITTGAAQSNHCRQTAAAAAKFGFDCILVLVGERPHLSSGNILLDELLGAKIIWTDLTHRDEVLDATFNDAWQSGMRPYLIPYGGSSPTGAVSYAYAIKEIMDQLQAQSEIPIPDWIIFASSSGGTQAGMVAGARLFGFPGKILGISVDENEQSLRQKVHLLATETIHLLDESPPFTFEEIIVNASYTGRGYGILGDQEKEAIKLFAKTEGILLDPVYTGRAAAGLIDLIRQNYFNQGEVVLFWHTGGTPALFAERYHEIIDFG
jgi:D-cysteine desulfhydrase family pyridoxal phosphate-dependent enzyme